MAAVTVSVTGASSTVSVGTVKVSVWSDVSDDPNGTWKVVRDDPVQFWKVTV